MSQTQYGNNERGPAGSRLGRGLVIVLLVLWSALAWGAYELVDWAIAWLGANTNALIETGQGAAGATGVGKDVMDVVESGRNSGLYDQILSLVRFIAAPAIVIVWAIGALGILALGFFGRVLGGLLRR